MAEYIDKSALVAEIERRISLFKKEKKVEKWSAGASQMNVISLGARVAALEELLSFINTVEVKDANEALRTEYEKGRADVIAKTLEWINVFNDNNYIMQYSDSCEHPINEIIEWYKNYINRE